MFEIICPECGKKRTVKQKRNNMGLCRSCAKKLNKPVYQEKECEFCGKLFKPNSNHQRYCKGPHIRICPVCGKEYKEDNVENLKRPPVACSYKCRAIKTADTSMMKYGCKAPGNNPEARKKASITMINNLGVPYAMQSPQVRHKAKLSLIKKFGVDNASKSPIVIEARLNTNLKRYGVPAAMCLPQYAPNRISKINRKFHQKLLENGIQAELEYKLDSKYYDICIPSMNVIIELNPTYTHSTIPTHWGTSRSKDYHMIRTKNCEALNYRCIHVFDWDDWDKVINMLKPKKTVYARQCEIYRLNLQPTIKFLDQYHLQGSCRGQLLCLGLVKNDQILQVMTFGKPRYNKNYYVELLRLCTHPEYRVIGGASKLFKFATQNYGLDNIISYCNRSKFVGSVYEKIGMQFVKTTQPQEIWSKEHQSITANLLRSHGYDQLFGTHYGKGTSNERLMLENGWLPVYDCGQAVFVFE